MKKNDIKYFLAANSCEGFYSMFDKAYLPDGEWRARDGQVLVYETLCVICREKRLQSLALPVQLRPRFA